MHRIKMRYSIEPRDRICVKGYDFCLLPGYTWVHMLLKLLKI